jgi:hypothetical protein
MEFNNIIQKHYEAEKGGSILVRCEGGYTARFSISYIFNGKEFSNHADGISLGVNKSLAIPAGATNIHLKVEEMWGFGWSTIFTKDFAKPVIKQYKVYNTTLDPKYAEI